MLKMYSEPDPLSDGIDVILARAEQEKDVPPEPEGGIPEQWVPNFIRWPIRALLLPLILIDQMAQKVARLLIRTPWKIEGKCLKRGNCCRYILVPEARGPLGRLYYFWNTQILGFYRRMPEVYENEKNQRVYVMGCRYLRKNGSCSHYHLRPSVCRNWPLIEYFGQPQILKGCGFRPIQRKKTCSHSQGNFRSF